MNNINKSLLFTFLLISKSVSTIDYNKDVYFLTNPIEKSFELSQKANTIALNSHSYLNLSPFFDTNLIKDSKKVLAEFSKDPNHKEIIIKTSDNHELTCSFFDRKKDKIIIIGPGFTNSKEKMAPFVHIFTDYDILIINFRGHGLKKSFSLSPFYNLFGVDTSIKLGMQEEQDVFAALNYAHQNKKYTKTVGIGICFGAFIFAKTQAIAELNNQPGFDKLILDGCWHSLKEFVEKLKNDPCLMFDPQRGGTSPEVRWLFKRNFISNSLITSIENLIGIEFEKVDLKNYLKNIKNCPILYFYGKDDLTINRQEFENIWNSTGTQEKLAIITSNPHVHNHLKSKELYKLICETFMEQDNIQNVIELFADPEKLLQMLVKKFEFTINNQLPEIYKPIKFLENQPNISFFDNYKTSILLFGSLLAGYKTGIVKSNTIKKITISYFVLKLIQFGWRPAIRLLASF